MDGWSGQDLVSGFRWFEGLLWLRLCRTRESEEWVPNIPKVRRRVYISWPGVSKITIWLTKCSFGKDLGYFDLGLLRAQKARDWFQDGAIKIFGSGKNHEAEVELAVCQYYGQMIRSWSIFLSFLLLRNGNRWTVKCFRRMSRNRISPFDKSGSILLQSGIYGLFWYSSCLFMFEISWARCRDLK